MQDDEALVLFALIRSMRLATVLEAGLCSFLRYFSTTPAAPPKRRCNDQKSLLNQVPTHQVGGRSGYSARNFVAATSKSVLPAVFTVDLEAVPSVAPNHVTLKKDAAALTPADVQGRVIDLLFLDAHISPAHMALLGRLSAAGVVTEATIVAVHDTNFHFFPHLDGTVSSFAHKAVEMEQVNLLKEAGYDILRIFTTPIRHSDECACPPA